MKKLRRRQEGQALIEYLILISIVIGVYLILAKGLVETKLAEKMTAPIRDGYASAYRYGHPKAKGFSDGGPENHPRARGGNNNFRIFFNPK
jgi:hypothetical protein